MWRVILVIVVHAPKPLSFETITLYPFFANVTYDIWHCYNELVACDIDVRTGLRADADCCRVKIVYSRHIIQIQVSDNCLVLFVGRVQIKSGVLGPPCSNITLS
jgi:hypothetical protein